MFKKWIFAFLLAFSLASGASFDADKINLNTASADQLQMIDGIGPATAVQSVLASPGRPTRTRAPSTSARLHG